MKRSRGFLLLFALNLADMVLTIVGMKAGYIQEINPLLADATLGQIALVKGLGVSLGILFLWWFGRENRGIRRLIWIGNLVYGYIFIRHIMVLLQLIAGGR